ncbi:MAG TPA: cupin domain-containing protein [Holophagaceae bacterium]|nr:cupin domain-containing protein [Holophagaceae bacterium]
MSQPALRSTFIVLDPRQAATPVPVTPGLYEALDADFQGFAGCWLMAEHAFTADWPTWEMHPKGDEILYLLSGEATLHLYADGVERELPFNTPGGCVIIPKGVWHTAKVRSACTLLFITPGEGTRNVVDPRNPEA